MWAGVLFFLFCVGMVFYVFEHINIWIQRNEPEQNHKPKSANNNNNNNDIVNSIKLEMAETPFLSSKYIFKKVSEYRLVIEINQRSGCQKILNFLQNL